VSPLVINHHTQPDFQATEDLAFPLVDFRESPASFTDNKRNSLRINAPAFVEMIRQNIY